MHKARIHKVSHKSATNHLKKSDPVLAAIIERVGPCRMQFGDPTFHALAESILYQQLNGKAAATIFDRFTALAGDPLTPQGILKLTDDEMRGVGLSRQKTAYLRDLSEKTKAGMLEFERLPGIARRRSDRASHPGQRRRRLDSPHVPDVHPAPSGYSPHRRLRRAGRHQKALQETQVAQARHNREDRKAVGALPLHRLLVSVEESGYQDGRKIILSAAFHLGFFRSAFSGQFFQVTMNPTRRNNSLALFNPCMCRCSEVSFG